MKKPIELQTKNRTKLYRFFEILPAAISIGAVVLLFALSAYSAVLGAAYLLLIILFNLVKGLGVVYRTVGGYHTVKAAQRVDWPKRLADLKTPRESYERVKAHDSLSYHHAEHRENLRAMAAGEFEYPEVDEVYHAVILTMYNETLDILRPTMESVLKTSFPKERMILMMAYEERGGAEAEKTAKTLEREYGDKFYAFVMSKHPANLKGEVIGKGANISYAGARLQKFADEKGLKYEQIIVTTLDSDNRPCPSYFDQVAYEYIVHPERSRLSYQPVSTFTNNIWDAPAITRVVASTNTFWNLVCTMRPHTLRNFASHSQPLDALVAMNFWSKLSITEDGHQYWRSLFFFDGDYEVLPIRATIGQDAVLDSTFLSTMKGQWKQIRRWDYGATDVAYVGTYMCSKERKIPLIDLIPKFVRLVEGHVTLAVLSPVIAFGGWVPLIFEFNSRNLLAHNLPRVVSGIESVATLMLLLSLFLSLRLLPPRPKRYKPIKKVSMMLQWILSPVIALVFTSFAAYAAQLRLALGFYIESFDVTSKAVKKD